MNKSWNPFLNLIISLKREYEIKVKKTFDYTPRKIAINNTCVNRWLDELNDEKFKNAFSGITLWQYKNYIIAHYVDFYIAIDENGNTIRYENFFNIYNRLYMECRGVVIDVEKEELVLAPFRKFRNLNECEETSLEEVNKRLKTAKTVELSDKLDGSMISAGIYNNNLVVAGSSCNHPDISPQVNHSYKYIQENDKYLKLLNDFKEQTFIFEYIFPKRDPHVVAYEKDGLYLIGIRNKEDGKEWNYKDVISIANNYDIPCTEIFNKTFEEVLQELDNKKANEAEGFVLNIDDFKVKIKYNDYVSVNKLIFGLVTPNGIMRAMEDNTLDDYISKIPEVYKELARNYQKDITNKISELNKIILEYANKIKNLETKEAMIWIKKSVPKKYHGFVISVYKNKPYSYLKASNGHYRTYKELEELLKN